MPGSQICRAAICLWLWKSCGCIFHIPWGWSCNNCVEMKIPYTNFGYFIWAEQKRFASWADLKFPRTPTEQREVKKWVDWLQSWAAGQCLRTSLALAHSFIRWWEMSPPAARQSSVITVQLPLLCWPNADTLSKHLLPTQTPPTHSLWYISHQEFD